MEEGVSIRTLHANTTCSCEYTAGLPANYSMNMGNISEQGIYVTNQIISQFNGIILLGIAKWVVTSERFLCNQSMKER